MSSPAAFGTVLSVVLQQHMMCEAPHCGVQVAYDEASHFQQLQQRLEAIGSHYGALPVHDGLWESAAATAHSLPARLAVESCVHEARGLDRLPHTIHRFRNAGDHKSAELLETIYQVQPGQRMTACLCSKSNKQSL